MFNDILGDKKNYRFPSDDPYVKREILELNHKSNSELLDMYFLWRQYYEDPKNKGWSRSIKEDLNLIEEEIFNR